VINYKKEHNQMSKKTVLLVGLLLIVVSLFAACAAPAPAPAAAPAAEEAAAAPADMANTVAFLPGQLANPSQAFLWKMIQKHAAEYGFDAIVLDGKGDVQEQAKTVNNAVAQGVEAMFVNPNDAIAIAPSLAAAKEAGVVVSIIMAKPGEGTEDSVDFYVAVDDILGGKVAAEAIMAAFPDGATGVEIGGQAGHDAAVRRHDGFAAGIEGTNITVLDYQNPQQWDTAQAQAIAEDMITKYGDQIQFVFCHWDNGATGVINALRAAGGMEDVLIIGVDGNKTGFDQVESWPNYISIAQNAETIAVKSMESANLFIEGDPAAQFDVVVPFDVITKETIGNFTAPEW
jgi:ABC-type sugar transport system substrate-binding protein